jgi:hypothetical protein
VVPVNSSLLTVTLFSSVGTTLVYLLLFILLLLLLLFFFSYPSPTHYHSSSSSFSSSLFSSFLFFCPLRTFASFSQSALFFDPIPVYNNTKFSPFMTFDCSLKCWYFGIFI